MSSKKGGLVWLWVLLGIGAVAAVGYGWYKYAQPETGEERVAVEVLISEEGARVETVKEGSLKDAAGKQGEALDAAEKPLNAGDVPSDQTRGDGISEKETLLKPQATGKMVDYQFKSDEKKLLPKGPSGRTDLDEGTTARKARYCDLVNQYVQDFFQYLDTKKYVQRLELGETAYARFKQILERLAAKPPIPAGEGVDPAIMVKNIYFFCRALDKKDLRLIKQVVSNDRDTLEDNMGMLYQWAMLGKGCPNPGDVRPSFDVLYRYAGFFLNTTGGRAYMFRRGLKVRLLVSYYSVQIIYQADKAGRNNYGIDVLPHIKMLMEEMGNYPDLQYKETYLETLIKIKTFYSGRR
ncbi:MAG: hypothetical protein HN366_12370 [Deltaproteobacteria bacterium]|nr:hypothetical protein [Deltaproteobacteria bacterium]